MDSKTKAQLQTEPQPDHLMPSKESSQVVELNLDKDLKEGKRISLEAERLDNEDGQWAMSNYNNQMHISVRRNDCLIIGEDIYNTTHQHSALSQTRSESGAPATTRIALAYRRGLSSLALMTSHVCLNAQKRRTAQCVLLSPTAVTHTRTPSPLKRLA